MNGRKVVITGLGVVAPGGVGTKAFWQTITSGRTATRLITAFDATAFRSRIAAEVDFDPVEAELSPREIGRLDRAAQFALVATRESVSDSGLEPHRLDPTRVGVSLGTAVGCTSRLESEYLALSDTGRKWLVDHEHASPDLYDYYMPGSMAAEVAWEVNAQGPVTAVSAGCTSGLDAIGHAVDLIREGAVDVMLAGGTDAPISPITVACFDAIRATSPSNDDPEHALRPFDRTRNGFVLGEGAAVLVLEAAEHARARGALIYAEITGFASRSNAYHMTGLRPDGAELAAAVTAALDESRRPADAIDYVNAHGTATRQNDRHETAALKKALGDHAYRIPVSSIKSMIGHSLGAVGSIEIAACALAIDQGIVPPTANLYEPDPELDLDYVPLEARERRLETVLSVGSGFGGFQSAMVLARPGEPGGMTQAVVTGIGVAAPNGLGTDSFWDATLRGESGIGPVRRFDATGYPSRLGGEIGGFEPAEHLSGRLIPQTDRMTQLALAASDWALRDADVRAGTYDDTLMGAVTAGASGGLEYGQRELSALWTQGPGNVSVYMSFAWFYAVNTGQISIRHALRGPAGVMISDQAGGLDAVAQARRNIRKGARLIVSGGMDSSFCPYGWVSRISDGTLSTSDDPGGAYLPFDVRAQGHVPGEGGAILVIEDAQAARERGAIAYGEIAGYGATFDAAARHGGGHGLRRAVEAALADADAAPADIGVVFADGSGTPDDDRAEAETITAVFGQRAVPVTVPKTMTGRMNCGGAPADLACALLSMRDEIIPPTINVRTIAPGCDIDLVTGGSRPWRPGAALVLARGRGGFNSAMVLRPAPPRGRRAGHRAAPKTVGDTTRNEGQP